MSRRDAILLGAGVVLLTLALAILIEKAHVRAFRAELDAWGKENSVNG